MKNRKFFLRYVVEPTGTEGGGSTESTEVEPTIEANDDFNEEEGLNKVLDELLSLREEVAQLKAAKATVEKTARDRLKEVLIGGGKVAEKSGAEKHASKPIASPVEEPIDLKELLKPLWGTTTEPNII